MAADSFFLRINSHSIYIPTASFINEKRSIKLPAPYAIMGASLFMQQRINLGMSDPKYIGGVGDAISYALGSGIGWMLAIVGLAAIREKMAYSVPQ